MVEGGNGGVALLVGAGDAIGAAVARRFAAGGYAVCVARRDAEKSRSLVQEIIASGGVARAVGTDVRSEEAVQALFAQVEAELGPVEVCLFNAGANVKSRLIETGAKLFFRVWELACYGGFLTGREAARYMVPRGRGTILFTGATSSVRRQCRLRRVCGGQVRPARGGPVDGARACTKEYSCCPSDHRWRDRQ
jgi:NAD(P)-dependent dehydrogenase (short-subunit alcohol dehydrogenase family)